MSPYRSMERRPERLARRRWFVKARLKKLGFAVWAVAVQIALAYLLSKR